MRNKTTTAKPANKATAIALTVALTSCFLFPAKAYSAGTAFLVDIAANRPNSGGLPQCASQPVIAAGLRTPVKLIFTQHGNLLVAEMGFGPNSGRISIVDPASGQQRTLLDGLPSGFILPSGISSGPSGLAMRGRTLYVSIGGGDSTLPGAALNSPVPNPNSPEVLPQGKGLNGKGLNSRVPNPNPSSPLLSSVLAVHFSAHVEQTTEGFTLTYADQLALHNGSEVTLDNGGGDKIQVKLVADFPDYVAEPLKEEPSNVRPADPFGLVISGDQLYVVDPGSNVVLTLDIHLGKTTTQETSATLMTSAADTAGKYGMELDGFTTSIRLFGDQLLVTVLSTCEECQSSSSDPAQVQIVDPVTGTDAPFITGRTTAVDVLPIRRRGHASEFLTLEMSANLQAGLPGRLRRYAAPDAEPVVIADCLNAPTSIALNERTGDLFITEIFAGRIVKVAAP